MSVKKSKLCNFDFLRLEIEKIYIFNFLPVCLKTKKCIPLECINCYPKVYNKSCLICKL